MAYPRWAASILLTLIVMSGCSTDRPSPEQQIRAMITAAEEAVESRSVTAVTPFIAEDYKDERGHDRRRLAKLLAGYFLGHQRIHLLVQVKELTLISDTLARVELLVAMAGQPIEGIGELIRYRADLHHFELQLERSGDDWLVSSGRWHRALADDFL